MPERCRRRAHASHSIGVTRLRVTSYVVPSLLWPYSARLAASAVRDRARIEAVVYAPGNSPCPSIGGIRLRRPSKDRTKPKASEQGKREHERMLLSQREAAEYLGVGLTHFKTLRDVLPRINLATPEAQAPVWRWHRGDLDGFIRGRRNFELITSSHEPPARRTR